ncbi:hypothetical protein FFIC_280710 [Fructobacillus ficulneus]|uniref:Uncharacterized protein n=1 Tax=Fructobacillus ficulneus TaxID=157463 RepID=A0A0K8MHN7_9LACO|nr:hypothetical protein FFIC_280710 [Fructobacillus ficulneus]
MKSKIFQFMTVYPRIFAIITVTVINLLYFLIIRLAEPNQSRVLWLNNFLMNVGSFAVLMALSWCWTKYRNHKK